MPRRPLRPLLLAAGLTACAAGCSWIGVVAPPADAAPGPPQSCDEASPLPGIDALLATVYGAIALGGALMIVDGRLADCPPDDPECGIAAGLAPAGGGVLVGVGLAGLVLHAWSSAEGFAGTARCRELHVAPHPTPPP